MDVDEIGPFRTGGEPAAEHGPVGEVAERGQRVVRALDQADTVHPPLAAGQPVATGENGDLVAAPCQPATGLQHVAGHALAWRQPVVGEERQPHQPAGSSAAARGDRATAVLQK